MAQGTCSLPGCDTALTRHLELCELHYNRRRVRGDPYWQPRSLEERLWTKVRKSSEPDGCWLWTGSSSSGYGYIGLTRQRRTRRVHCVAYELTYGPIPEGTEIDHLCRVTLCVRPDHLEAVTHRTNVLRGEGPTARNAQMGTCARGHPFDLLNTYWRSDGGRRCRACKRLNANRRRSERKAAASR